MTALKIPFIDIQSSDNYEIGHAIGRALLKKIHLREEWLRRTSRNKLDNFDARKFADDIKRFFPQYFRELTGMAAGAEIDINVLLLITSEEETTLSSTHDKCTTVAVSANKTVLLGHNEDWISGYEELMYVVRVRNSQNSFLSLAYAGDLPGSSVALNEKGIAFSGNSILHGSQRGVPKSIILRSQIEAHDLDEFAALAVFSPRMIPNHTMAIDSSGNVVSVEAALHGANILKTRSPYAHTNHLIHHPDLDELERNVTRSSIFRLLAAEKYVSEQRPPRDLLCDILKSHEAAYSICRHALRGDLKHSQTIASAIADVENLSLAVAVGNPCLSDYETFFLQ